jgi:phosphoglucomutase
MKQSAMDWRNAPTSSTNSWTVDVKELAGDPIRAILTPEPGTGESIEGLKAVTDDGQLAVRPSGTEDVNTLNAESFRDR